MFKTFKSSLCQIGRARDLRVSYVKEDVLGLVIDEETVQIKNAELGGLQILCSCKFCSSKGEARRFFCSRCIKAIEFLLVNNGIVQEIQHARTSVKFRGYLFDVNRK